MILKTITTKSTKEIEDITWPLSDTKFNHGAGAGVGTAAFLSHCE